MTIITTRALGIDTDVSQYPEDRNGNPLVPAVLTGQKLDFVITKMSEGNYINPKFKIVYDAFGDVQFKGVYHYQRGVISWQLQADNLLKNLPTDCRIIALDLEQTGNVFNAGYFADASRILNYWKLNAPQCKVIYYTGPYIYVDYLLPIMLKNYPTDNWYLDFPLWIATWPSWKPSRSPNLNPSLPKNMRGDWKILQWDEAGDKPPYSVYGSPDLDVFNGPVSDMAKWLGVAPTLPPIEPPVVTKPKITITVMGDVDVEVVK